MNFSNVFLRFNLLFIAFFSIHSFAATFNVTTNNDSGIGSLRNAIISANANGDTSNSIEINQGLSPIVLASPLPIVNKNLSISVNGGGVQVINGNNLHRPFFFKSGSHTISNLEIQNGLAQGGNGGTGTFPGGGGAGCGGGLFVYDGVDLSCSNVNFINCSAQGGNGGSNSGGRSGGGGGIGGNGGNGGGFAGSGGGGFIENGGSVPQFGDGNGGSGGGSFFQGGNSVQVTRGGGAGGGGTTASGTSNIGINGGSGGISCGGGGGGSVSNGIGGGSDSCGNSGGSGTGFVSGIGGNGGTDNVTGMGGGGGGSGGAYPNVSTNAGNGGFGGGGAGLGDGEQNNPIQSAGDGGFGGGGGSSGGGGGNGGFGGGGAPGTTSDGISPFGGGNSSNDNGAGGGAAFGGSIIIHNGGYLTLTDPQISGSSIQEGTGTTSTNAGNGVALGTEIFLMSGGTLTFNISSGTFILQSAIESDQGAGGGTGGGLIKTGGGTLDLSSVGTQTYTNSTIIQEGLIRLETDDNFGPLTNTVSLDGGGIYPNASFTSTARPIQIISSGIIRVDNGNSFTVPTTISGIGSALIKEGQGTLNLSGVNTYTGQTTITGGTLRLVGGGTLGSNGPLNIVSPGMFEIAAGAGPRTIGTLTGNGGIDLNNNNLSISDGNFSGSISGTGEIEKITGGTLTLSGASTYSGGTTVTAGTLSVGADNHFGTGALSLNGGVFEATTSFSSSKLVSIGGPAAIQTTSAGTTLQLNGSMSGFIGSLDKTGAGTLELGGSNTFTVPTTVNGGLLTLVSSGTLGNASDLDLVGGGFEVAAGAGTKTIGTLTGTGTGINLNNNTLEIASGSYGGVISGTGGITKYSGGTLDLSGGNNYTGQSTISGGLLRLVGSGTLGNTTDLNIAGGGFEIATGAGTKTIGALTGAGTGINLNNNTFEIASGSFSGVISGAGGITKYSGGTLDLSEVNTYTGQSTVSGGLLRLVGSGTLGNAADLDLVGGGFEIVAGAGTKTIDALTGAGTGINLNNNTLEIASGSFSGVISGTGGITKYSPGILNLSGVNTYTGQSTVSGGLLRLVGSGTLGNITDLNIIGGSFEIAAGAGIKTIGALTGAGTGINLNNNTLEIASGLFSGVISGTGGITKYSPGILSLSGVNTYTGSTTLTDGIVSISGSHNLGAGGHLIFNGGTLNTTGNFAINNPTNMLGTGTFSIQTGTLTHQGMISGIGNLNKTGVGTLHITASSPYSGNLIIQQGKLILDSTLSCPITVNSTAFLSGNGAMGSLQNNGTVIPGSSIGTLAINGDYTQSNQASLVIEIDDVPAISDKLLISGQADLDGTIILNPLPGLYEAGTTYTFIESNSINGKFDALLETNPLDFSLNYTSNTVQIVIPFSEVVLPVPIDTISGNAKNIAKYLFSCKQLPSPDLVPILRSLVKLPPEQFTESLLKLGPEQFGALALERLQTSARIGQSMNQTNSFYEDYYLTPCYHTFNPTSSSKHMTWVSPLGYYYKQNQRDEQIPFENRTYGFTTGFGHCFSNHLVLSGGFGYTYSNLNWKQNRGDSHIQSIYLSPSIGYISPRGYIGLSLVGSRSFYDVKRSIAFSSFKETAQNYHKSWDLLAEMSGSIKFKVPEIVNRNLFLISSFTINYLNIFESGYQESGAGPIDLSVRNVHSAFFRPEVTVKLLKELTMNSLCSAPSIYIGWQKNIPLTQGNYTSRFYKQDVCSKNFTVKSYHSSTDQLVLGTDLIMAYKANWSLKLGYKASIGDHFNIQEGTVNFNWSF